MAKQFRIGLVAPSSRFDGVWAERLKAALTRAFGAEAPELIFHDQCFYSRGHFAGSDAERTDAFVDFANDPGLDAIWFARGGYGACRIAEGALPRLAPYARDKVYMGYSDAGFLLGGLYAAGIGIVAHGPLAADIVRPGGEAAIVRAVSWMQKPEPPTVRPQLAFNLTVLSQMIGTPLLPDMTGHILMIEEVSEYMYRIDRSMFHVTSQPAIRRAAGLKLGRCSLIPENDPDFGQSEEEICRFWCEKAGIAYLGRANIGHDADNAIIRFG